MGFEHLSAVLSHAQKGGSHLNILLIIASYSDQRGEWVSDQPTLQKQARLGRRRVQQLLAELTATGELAVIPGDGRGHRSTYRLLFNEAPCALPARKSEAACTQSASTCALSHPPCPPCPPFPPDPQYPLNPPNPPEKQQQETFGLAPAPTSHRQARQAQAKQGRAARTSAPELPFPPLPAVGRVGAGRGAGGEGSAEAAPASLRAFSPQQSAVFRTHLLLEEHAIPLPTPAQIGLWAKTLGGIEPLLDLLRRLVQAGLATKREPLAYIHRVVLEKAAHPAPFSPLPVAGGAMGEGPGVRGRSSSWRVGRQPNPVLAAGIDDRRREHAARIIAAAKQGACW